MSCYYKTCFTSSQSTAPVRTSLKPSLSFLLSCVFVPARAVWAMSATPVVLAGKNKKSCGVWKQHLSPLTSYQCGDKSCQSQGRCFKMKPIPVLVLDRGSEGTCVVACCGQAGQVAVTKSRCNSSILGSEGRGLGTSLPLDQRRQSSLQVPLTSLPLVFIRTFHFIPLLAKELVPPKVGPSHKCYPWVSQCHIRSFPSLQNWKKIKAEFAKVRQEKNVQLKRQYKQG